MSRQYKQYTGLGRAKNENAEPYCILRRQISDSGKNQIKHILCKSKATNSFISSAEQAVSTYFKVQRRYEEWQADGVAADRFKKLANQSKKISETISLIPESRWVTTGWNWPAKNGGKFPYKQKEIVSLLEFLAVSAEDQSENSKPKSAGPRKKAGNWFLIDVLAKSFNINFPDYKVSRNKKSKFYKVVTVICENSVCEKTNMVISFADPEQAIKKYLANS